MASPVAMHEICSSLKRGTMGAQTQEQEEEEKGIERLNCSF